MLPWLCTEEFFPRSSLLDGECFLIDEAKRCGWLVSPVKDL
jgi:hypothetical protein